MTAALVVAVLVALVCGGGWAVNRLAWSATMRELRQHADDYREAHRRAALRADERGTDAFQLEQTLAAVSTALTNVWHHVTPETPEEGAAVAVLRAACPGLPVPESHGPPNLRGNGWYGAFAGQCPVQGFGMVDGRPFYFRARGSSWSLGVALPGKDPVMCPDDGGWAHEEDWPGGEFDAGWMTLEDAQACMNKAVGLFHALAKVTP